MLIVHSIGMSCQISVKLPFISSKLPLWRTAAMQCILCIDDPACFLTACVSQVHPGACSGWCHYTTPLSLRHNAASGASTVPMQAGWNPVTVSAKVKRKTMPCSLPPIQQCTALTTGTASRQRIAGSLRLRTHRGAIKTIWLSPSSHFKRETLFSGTFMT